MKKIPTLFERRFEGHKIVEVLPNITPGCEEAFEHGIATIKIDGSCCAIIDGQFYKRYDAKAGKPIPDGAIKCQDKPDPITGHMPCWVRVDRDKPEDKWFVKARDRYVLMNGWGNPLPDGTYEAIGKHFQGNPYGKEEDIIEPHGAREITVSRTFEGVREWLKEHYCEGIVFWLDGNPICKIKRSDFGFEWNGKQART